MMTPDHATSLVDTDPDPPTVCPRCGSSETIFARCTEGPHYGKIRCLDCGYKAFVKTPWTLARASRFTMPYGKHRGRTLAELADDPAGRDYLRWLADPTRDTGNPGIAARIMLEHVDAKRMSS
jgi:uncharacterized protein (DUF3820 family)